MENTSFCRIRTGVLSKFRSCSDPLHVNVENKTASFRSENWRFWSGLRDSNPRSLEPKSSAIPNFAKSGYEIKGYSKCGQLCGQRKMARGSANYLGIKSGDLLIGTG